MKKFVIFNLKMNAPVLADWKNIVKSEAEVVVCPPFLYIPTLQIANCKLKIGAQNVFWANEGAYTGEISPKMLKNSGVEYVIIGHSERRKYLDETDEMINKKVLATLKAGLKVMLCVGEQKRGLKKAKNYVKKQLEKDLKGIGNWKLKIENLAIAYEPVWAISTSKNVKSCPPEYALEMIKFIKEILNTKYKIQNTKVLYGGSVNGKNILDFVKYSEIDGVLVGGAGLNFKEVTKIIKKVG